MPSIVQTLKHKAAERQAENLVPVPLDAEEANLLVEAIKGASPGDNDAEYLLEQLEQRIPPGVDDAAYVKAGFLAAITKGEASSALISPTDAVRILGTMQGGYNVQPLIDLLDNEELGEAAAGCLSRTLLVYDSFLQHSRKS